MLPSRTRRTRLCEVGVDALPSPLLAPRRAWTWVLGLRVHPLAYKSDGKVLQALGALGSSQHLDAQKHLCISTNNAVCSA